MWGGGGVKRGGQDLKLLLERKGNSSYKEKTRWENTRKDN